MKYEDHRTFSPSRVFTLVMAAVARYSPQAQVLFLGCDRCAEEVGDCNTLTVRQSLTYRGCECVKYEPCNEESKALEREAAELVEQFGNEERDQQYRELNLEQFRF